MKARAFEIDWIRGIVIIIVLVHHFGFDLQIFLGAKQVSYIDSFFFEYVIRPLTLFLIFFISGLSSSFSRSNFKRAKKMIAIALLLSLASIIYSQVSKSEFYLFQNVILLIGISSLIYALYQKYFAQTARSQALLLILASLIIWSPQVLLPHLPRWTIFFPLGVITQQVPSMIDYQPLLPWLGFFLLGAICGELVYPHKASLFKFKEPSILKPLSFLGRYSLYIYALHQPIFLALLYLYFEVIR